MAFASLVVYAITLLIRPHEWGTLVNDSSSIVRNSLILCLILFIFHQNKNLKVPQLPLMVMLEMLVLSSVVATGWIGGGLLQGEEFIRTAFIPFLLVSGLVDSLRKQQVLFIILIAASLLMVINGHVQVNSESGIGFLGNPPFMNSRDTRITYFGFFSDPNDLGMFLIMSLPIFFYFKAKTAVLLRPIFWIGITVVLYGILLTNSRGTLLGLLALLSFWFWRKYSTTKSVLMGLIMSPAAFFLLSSFREISTDDASSQGRLDAWYAGMQMFFSNPFLGVGQGLFTEHHDLTAHNSFVLAFSEMGIFGCLVWVALLVVAVVSLIGVVDKKFLRYGPLSETYMATAEQEARIAKTILYGFLAYFVTGFFLSRTYVPILYFYLGMSAACLGRVKQAYPNASFAVLCPARMVAKLTLAITFGGITGIYLLVRLFL